MIQRTLAIVALALQSSACGETAPPEIDSPPNDSQARPSEPRAYGAFEAYWPRLSSAEAAADAHRGAEILLGRALPLQAFLDSAARALESSDRWEGFPLGDGILHVKYYAGKNDMRLTNETLNQEAEADFTLEGALSERGATDIASAAFEQLARAGVVETEHFGDRQFKIGKTEFLMGNGIASETRRVTTQFRFLANRRLNGIAFLNAGVSVGVHVTGRLSHLRFGGARVVSRMAEAGEVEAEHGASNPAVIRQALAHGEQQLRERPVGGGGVFVGRCEERQAKRRFQRDFPFGEADWSELRYFLPDAAQGPTLIEPLHVLSFANHYGTGVSRRQYVGYPVRDPDAPRVLISEPPNPEATGDERK